MKVLVIAGSARAESHTRALVDAVLAGRDATRIDLRDLNIQHYEYGGRMDRDDFGQVVTAMVEHEIILFATPVYWYAMSGRLKVLFDRFSDLATVRKDLGRQLKGRSVAVLACGADMQLPDGFEVPFRETSAYLGMAYGGVHYTRTNDLGLASGSTAAAAAFGRRLFEGEK